MRPLDLTDIGGAPMMIKSLKLMLVLVVITAVAAPVSWAAETAYGYIISYSYRDKVVYHTPVFSNQVSGKSYNDEEFVSDTKSQMALESAFQKHLIAKYKLNPMNLTTSARVTYKTEQIAKNKLDNESRDFMFKGLQIKQEAFTP